MGREREYEATDLRSRMISNAPRLLPQQTFELGYNSLNAWPRITNLEFAVVAVASLCIGGAADGIFSFVPQLELSGPFGFYNGIYVVFRRSILVFAAIMTCRDVKATALLFLRVWPLTISLVWIVASSLWSLDPWRTFVRATSLVSVIVMAAGVVSRHGVAGIMKSIRIAGFIVLVSNLALLVTAPPFAFDEYGQVFRGTFLQKNGLALFSTCFVVCTLAELSAVKNLRALLTNLGLVLAALVLIVQSHSVTGMLISSGALLIASFLWFYQKFQAGPLVKIVTTGCVVLLVIVVGVVGRDELLYGFGRDITLTGRTVVWRLAWQSIMDRPILGFGYGSYWTSQSGAEYYFGDSWIPPGAHNGFLDALLGGGAVLIGLVLYQTWLLIKRSIGYVLASQSSMGWFVVLVGGLFPIYNLVESIYLKDYSVSTLLFVTALFTVGIRDQRKAN